MLVRAVVVSDEAVVGRLRDRALNGREPFPVRTFVVQTPKDTTKEVTAA